MGPKTDPWGTPQFIVVRPESKPSGTTLAVLSTEEKSTSHEREAE